MMNPYRALLRLYPVSYRHEYGGEMEAVFARQWRDVSAAGTVPYMFATIVDVVIGAAAVHLDILRQDLRTARRSLLRARGFSLTVIAVVAIGIGATTAAFTVTDFVLVRPLPYRDSERLVRMYESSPGGWRNDVAPVNYRDWKRMATSFEALGAHHSLSANVLGAGEPMRLDGAAVTGEVFAILGVQPLIGRTITEQDDRSDAPGVVVLSHTLWLARFGGEAAVLGRKIAINDAPYEVIGVMPPQFNFPTRAAQLWVPARFGPQAFEDRNNNYIFPLGRLKSGVNVEAAQAEMDVIARQLRQQYPRELENVGVAMVRLRDEVSAQAKTMLWALCGASLCVLLIACANVASLMLARATARQRELAVRAAIGAGRERLLRQLFTESLLLALIGGGAGILLAQFAVPLLTRLVPTTLPIAELPPMDLRVLGIAILLTVVTALLFGILPAWRASGTGGLEALRDAARAGGGRRQRLRSALVVAEITASVVLLVTSGLLLRALWNVQQRSPGFNADNVLTLRTALPMPKYAETAKRAAFYEQVLAGVRSLPGVQAAAYITSLPMVQRGGIWPVGIAGLTMRREDGHTAAARFVTGGYFAAMQIPLVRGREINETDTKERPYVVVVSESLVRRYWPGEDGLGRVINFGGADRTIVGIVGDVRVRGLEQTSEPQVYMAYRQVDDRAYPGYPPKDLVIRTAGEPAAILGSVRAIIARADPDQPISEVRLLEEIVAGETLPRALQARVLSGFAAIAFGLAAIGIYGLLSLAVAQRAQEFAVRMALGAEARDVLRIVWRQGIVLAALGIVPGAVLAYMAARLIRALLAEVGTADPVSFAVAITLCAVMTVIGGLLPAMRAARVNPGVLMKTE